MDIKGVCYDVGRAYSGQFLTRLVFDPASTRRELQIIRDDLHCNAVRFQGTDIGRLMTAATDALKLGGLQVWFSPELFEKSREETLAYLVQAATAAEPLREQFPGQLVFCVGTESSLFTRGIVPGKTVNQRLANILRAGPAVRCLRPGTPGLPRRGGRTGPEGVPRADHLRLGHVRGGRLEPVRLHRHRPLPELQGRTPLRRENRAATSGRASPWSIPSSGTVRTGGTGLVTWSSARWTWCRWR